MKGLLLTAVGIAAVGLSGCATITRGQNTTWTVETTPSGATVRTTAGFACDATPCTFKMPRKSEFGVTIAKPGYKTWQGQVTNRVSGAGGAGMAGNIVFGGVIGAGVDATTGAMLDLVPNPLVVTLERADEAASTPAAAPATASPAPQS